MLPVGCFAASPSSGAMDSALGDYSLPFLSRMDAGQRLVDGCLISGGICEWCFEEVVVGESERGHANLAGGRQAATS